MGEIVWTMAMINQAREMVERGVPGRKIADALGVDYERFRSFANRRGISYQRKPGEPRFWTQERLEKLVELANSGLTNAQIGEHFGGVTAGGISHQLKKMRKAGINIMSRSDSTVTPPTFYRGHPYAQDEVAMMLAPDACDAHLEDLWREHPEGPPPDVVVRTLGYAPRTIRQAEVYLP